MQRTTLKTVFTLLLALAAALAVPACDGGGDDASDEASEAMEEGGEAMQEGGEALQQGAEDAADAAEDAADDAAQ